MRREVAMASTPIGDTGNNRVDSANLTLSMFPGIVLHELGHLMGLPDEYHTDLAIGFNAIGEINSLMRNSHLTRPEIFPRHIDQILSPLRCRLPSGT